ALRITAVQTRHASVEHDRGRGIALRAELRALRESVLRERILLHAARLEFLALLLEELLLLRVRPGGSQQPDADQVLLDDVTELGNDRRHELAARLPIAAARIEHGLQ